MDTYSDILRKWSTAGDLQAGLAAHGCDASEVLIRRWWNDEMLPVRAWRPLVELAQEKGIRDITTDRLIAIASTDRRARLAFLSEQRKAGQAA